MTDEENESVAMAECGACRAVIPIDSAECPECATKFSGISEDALGECGACQALVPLDSTRCPECGVLFVADDVVDILRQWVADTGINIRKLFDKFDENDDGTIDSDELKRGLLSLNLADLPPSQVDRLVAEIDADGNGVIDLDEFDAILMGSTADQEEAPEAIETDEAAEDDASDLEGEEDAEEADEESTDAESDAEEADASAEDEAEEDAEEDESAAEEDEDEVDEEEDEAHGIDDEAFDIDEEEDSSDAEAEEEPHRPLAALSALADLMDEHDISAQRLFNELDADGNGVVSISELKSTIAEKYGDDLDLEQVNAIMDGADVDGDGTIDITEFIGSLEDYETMEELVEEKIFPSPWQKRMMSKSWNDTVWPILHVAFGIMVALFIANGMFGFVDGTGGNVAYIPNDSGLIPSGNIVEGDIYPCDEKFQMDGCRNSLTPLAGANGSLSMPTGFYWDGIMLIALSVIGMATTLFLHLVKAPEWRARAKAMKEFESDKAEAAESTEESSDETDEDEAPADEDETEDDEAYEEDDELEDDVDENTDDEDIDDDAEEEGIDIGSHIGLVFDDEEVFGVIVEFDDEEETVTIEEDGTGDLVTGYQEDMFLE